MEEYNKEVKNNASVWVYVDSNECKEGEHEWELLPPDDQGQDSKCRKCGMLFSNWALMTFP